MYLETVKRLGAPPARRLVSLSSPREQVLCSAYHTLHSSALLSQVIPVPKLETMEVSMNSQWVFLSSPGSCHPLRFTYTTPVQSPPSPVQGALSISELIFSAPTPHPLFCIHFFLAAARVIFSKLKSSWVRRKTLLQTLQRLFRFLTR